jgi:hypothetical protein
MQLKIVISTYNYLFIKVLLILYITIYLPISILSEHDPYIYNMSVI